MSDRSTFDKFPFVPAASAADTCHNGWPSVIEALRVVAGERRVTLCVECYPGVSVSEVAKALTEGLRPAATIRADHLLKPPAELNALVQPSLTDDPVFGRVGSLELIDFFNPGRLASAQEVVKNHDGRLLVVGVGASLVAPNADLVVYADLARWEIQRRHRLGITGGFSAADNHEKPAMKYKRGYFVEWPAADRLKRKLLPRIDYLLDTNDAHSPKLVTGDALRRALKAAVARPFSLAPFFDPGPWGGQWMRRVCGLPDGPPNYAWCFNCVPEENSLLIRFGNTLVEIPSIDLVYLYPRELLGDNVYSRFGPEFPIRFDFLDTMNGGNLSLQVHPVKEYIQQTFGMPYTQDESYYLLDAGDDAAVYLGLREGVDRTAMLRDLETAQDRGCPFPAERYVNRFTASKHDHFLIPAGTVHSAGKNCMVLEISATPSIFTLKLWDWQRLGLDGEPRPLSLSHGEANIQWDRTTSWVLRNLMNRTTEIARGECWVEEKTGLHELEFIETRRHWFSGPVAHHTEGTVNVLNLVEGAEVSVESPCGAFDPAIFRYAETCIVPAAVGPYVIKPSGGLHATIKAFVRTS